MRYLILRLVSLFAGCAEKAVKGRRRAGQVAVGRAPQFSGLPQPGVDRAVVAPEL